MLSRRTSNIQHIPRERLRDMDTVGLRTGEPEQRRIQRLNALQRGLHSGLLTDLDDASVADQLTRAVKLLSPPHLVVVAGIRSSEIAELAQREAHNWLDPWVSLAAEEHEARAQSQRALLRRLGVPVIAANEVLLEQEVLAEYEFLRRSRRI